MQRGNTEVVRVLLTQSDVEFDINATSGSLKRTALHQAAKNGKAEVVSLLLENGADAKIHDTTGKTALSLSGSSWSNNKSLRREPLILALIDHDAATAAQDSNLMANAAMNGSAKVIEKLVDLNADPSKQDEHGWYDNSLHLHSLLIHDLSRVGHCFGDQFKSTDRSSYLAAANDANSAQ